jgi:hypothetical protein
MPRPTFLDAVDIPGAQQHVAAMLLSGSNADGTPYHPDSGTPVLLTVTPDADGARLPNTPCKYVMLRNDTGAILKFGFAAATPAFNLLNAQEVRVNVENANMIWIFDADAGGLEFNAYAIV